ncbi:MAG: tetratricopeptide repeat protein [Bacteroidales bacterium]
MRTIKLIILIFAITAISACKSAREKKLERIVLLEKELINSTAKIDSTKAQQLIDLYISYADQFNADTISPVLLFKAADISMNIIKLSQSIMLLDRIMLNYPQYSKIPDCLFLKAFIYENQAKDIANAEKYYREFLQKYPTHEMAPSAKAAIDNLGIPLEMLIKSFEAKNKANKNSIQ